MREFKILDSVIVKLAKAILIGGRSRRMRGGKVPADMFMDIESQYVSDSGMRAPLAENYDELDGSTGFGGLGCIADGLESDTEESGGFSGHDATGLSKPSCFRPAPVYGLPNTPNTSVSVMPALAAEEKSGLGCCKTTIPERKQMRKWYKKHRRQELKERKKERAKTRRETRERPGGLTHNKRKTYRPRDYPGSIDQPSRSLDPHEVSMKGPMKPRRVPQVRQKNVEAPVQIREINAMSADEMDAKIARAIEAVTEAEIVKRYHVRNHNWHLDAESGFVAEASMLGDRWLDPWGRPLIVHNMKPMKDREGETTHWTGFTTVKGEKVRLTIFND
jgi:hypothetical protein